MLYTIVAGVTVLLLPLGVVIRAPILARLKLSLERLYNFLNS